MMIPPFHRELARLRERELRHLARRRLALTVRRPAPRTER
jgi:hypothetical protein